MKENDWLVAGIMNPDKKVNDFLASGLSVENTQLLSADQYKSSPFIQQRFTKNGKFDEDSFDQFYRQKVSDFGDFQNKTVEDTYLYSPFDPRAKKGNKLTKDTSMSMSMIANPSDEVFTISGDRLSSSFSDRERAQQNRIYNTATGTWSDDTLNDRTLFSSPIKWLKTAFGEPLVYATYNEDGTHYDPFTGTEVEHRKGQYKLDKFGNPYTETLNGRSLVGKDIVSVTDFMTIDGTGLNHYDFMDSDDLDKSVGGTLMKTVAAVAPMLIPGVSTVYSGFLVSREMLKTLPMLYGITTAWFDTPAENPILNRLAGTGMALTTSTSDYGRSSMLNAEALFSMISDVALQYGQQQFIAKGVRNLRGTKDLANEAQAKALNFYGKEATNLRMRAALAGDKAAVDEAMKAAEKYIGNPEKWYESALGKAALDKFMKPIEPILQRSNRLGADMALAYMALVSNTDVYSSMLEHGASRKEAASVALGSTIGMFGVDRFLGLGELFFDDLTSAYERQMRGAFKNSISQWQQTIGKNITQDTSLSSTNKIKKLFQKGIEFGKKQTSQWIEDIKYHSTGFWGKSFGEGLEEVSEEVVTDISKGIYEVLGELGFDTTVKKVGAFEEALPRYGMSFLGGTIGGGLFYGVHVYQNGKFHVDTTQDEIIYLVRNGRTKELLDTLEKWRKKGKLGSTSLSMRTTKDSNGNETFLTAESEEDSQNEYIYNRIKETILSFENIINENRANLNEDELFENMILSEVRFQDLDKLLRDTKTKDLSYITRYQQDYQNAISRIANLEGQWEKANRTITGIAYENEEEQARYAATDEKLRHMSEEEKKRRAKNLKLIEDSLKVAKEDLQKFNNGEYSLQYVEKMLFALDSGIHGAWAALTFDEWLMKEQNRTPNQLSQEELKRLKAKYLEYKEKKVPLELSDKFALYDALKKQINPTLLNIQDGEEKFIEFQMAIRPLLTEGTPLFGIKQYTLDDVLDFAGETEESENYVHRNDNVEIYAKRYQAVVNENNRLLEEAKKKTLAIIKKAGGFIDPVTRRQLKLLFKRRSKDAIRFVTQDIEAGLTLSYADFELSERDRSVLRILEDIDPNDLDSKGKVLQQILDFVKNEHLSPIKKRNADFNVLKDYFLQTQFSMPIDVGESADDFTVFRGRELSDAIDQHIAKRLEGKEDNEENRRIALDEVLSLDNTELWNIEIDDTKPEGKRLRAIVNNFLTRIKKEYSEGTINDYEWGEVSVSNFLGTDEELQQDLDKYQRLYKDYISKLKTNPIVTMNKELDAVISNINPVTELIKRLGLSLNTNMNNLEKILSDLDTRFEEEDSIGNITLTTEEKESLQEAAYIIELAQSYLQAATKTRNLVSPFGHNATINEFAQTHKDIYKDFEALPVISEDVAAMFMYELERYRGLIGVYDPETKTYNTGSWLELSRLNEFNKEEMFVQADLHWTSTIYDLFSFYQDYFKFEYDGTKYDLLKGMNSIPPINNNTVDGQVHLNKLLNLFYNNVQELIEKGWTYQDIWERSQILDNITRLDEVIKQKTCTIDQNVSLKSLTDYDKMIILCTAAAMESTKFYAYLRDRVQKEEGIAPLTIQEWLSRVGIALHENKDIFKQTAQYVKDRTGDERPFVFGLFYTGNAGSGKSSVVGRNVANYEESSNIWLSTPKESQINTLYGAISKGKKFLNFKPESKEEATEIPILIENLGIDLNAYNEAMKILQGEETIKQLSEGKTVMNDYFTVISKDTLEGDYVVINPDKFGIKKVKDAPKMIIIDEATHLNSIAIQLISAFADINGASLHFLGDNKQRGCTFVGNNLNRENVFTIRTPNLGITLRDNNVQHSYNLNLVEKLINDIIALDMDPKNKEKYETQVKAIISKLKGLKFKVYNTDDINGELITKSLDKTTIDKIKNGSVGFVGSDGTTLNALRAANLNLTVMQPTNIQGQEFDYVVIDKSFDIPNMNSSGWATLQFLQDLYTMISRGRNGTILIDPSGALKEAIGENTVEFVQAPAANVKEFTKRFREQKLQLLTKILGPAKATEDKKSSTESSTDEDSKGESVDKRVLSKDFRIEDLDFKKNLYVTYSTTVDKVDDILENGLVPDPSLADSASIVSEEQLKTDIQKLSINPDTGDSTVIVLMEFPKETFKNKNEKASLTTIAQKLDEAGNETGLVPVDYIKNVINIISEMVDIDEMTHEEDKDNPPEVIEEELDEIMDDDIPTSLEEIPGSPILAYGEATFTGMGVEVRDGRKVWINNLPKGEGPKLRRNTQIFTDDTEIADLEQQKRLSNMISLMKEGFLYRKPYGELHEDIRKKISEKAYNEMKWAIEVRPVDPNNDNFILGTLFKENGTILNPDGTYTTKDLRAITSKGLVFSVVGEFEMNNGDIGQVTLGLLSDPENWINRNSWIINNINEKIAKLEKQYKQAVGKAGKRKRIEAKIKHFEAKKKSLNLKDPNSDPIVYNQYLEELASRYDGSKPVRVPIPKVVFPGLTDIHKQKMVVRLTRISSKLIRDVETRIATLEQRFKEASGNLEVQARIDASIRRAKAKLEQFKQMHDISFRALNPRARISPMYIYTPSTRGKYDIDDSIIGKYNLVFGTADTSLSEEKLMEIYMAQKEAAAEEVKEKGFLDIMNSPLVPSVRLLPLINLGVSFQELSDPYMQEAMHAEVSYYDKEGKVVNHEQIYPFKTNYMGARMYVGLWNFRANLQRFSEEFTTFVEGLGFSLDNLEEFDKYVTVKDLMWRQKNVKNGATKLTKIEKEYLSKNKDLPNFASISEKIDQFNDSLGNKVKQFRLGSSLENGAYVRKLTGDLKHFYGTNKGINGIYLNSKTLQKYLNLAESIFTNVLDHIISCNYDTKGLLSIKKGVKNSLTGHITEMFEKNGNIEIHDPYTNEAIKIQFDSVYDPKKLSGIQNSFSHIPAVLSKVYKYTTMRQQHLKGNSFDVKDRYAITVKATLKDGESTEEVEKVIPYDMIWEHLDMNDPIADPDDGSLIAGLEFDDSLSNFFSFAFHGTIDELYSEASVLRDIPKASDALFPKGMFGDPLSTTETNPGAKMFTKAVQHAIFSGANFSIGLPTFFLDMRDLKSAVEDSRVPEPEKRDSVTGLHNSQQLIAETLSKYPQLEGKLVGLLEDLNEIEDSERVKYATRRIAKAIESITKANFNSIFTGNRLNVDINTLVKQIDKTEALTFAEFVASEYKAQFNRDLGPITNNPTIDRSDGTVKIFVETTAVSLQITKGNKGTIIIEEIGRARVEGPTLNDKVSELLDIARDYVDAQLIQQVEKMLKTYAKLDDMKKIEYKSSIINMLTKIGNELVAYDAFDTFDEKMQEVSDKACI